MNVILTNESSNTMEMLIDRIKKHKSAIDEWLTSQEGANELPLYSSVDVRDAGFKMAVVDTNIFPAGFNNICEHGIEDAVELIKAAIYKRVSGCKNILIIAEEHTRNTWYLENLRIIEEIIIKAGFNVKIATFLDVQPAFCQNTKAIELETATGKTIRIYCFKKILENMKNGTEKFCLAIMNNDLTTGIPDILKESNIPIYPSIQAGWHSRLKSHHFKHVRDVMAEFAYIIDVDPWLLSTEFTFEDDIDINYENDRKRLYDSAVKLLVDIQKKYDQHGIKEKAYIFLKADAGTYGMGVLPIEDPQEILNLNSKNRNKLYKGKNSKVIGRYLLQEGVPTIYNVDQKMSEVVMYQIENKLIGGFYRSHSAKSGRENLNSTGMEFKKICPHDEKYCDAHKHTNVDVFDVYRILARIAGIAAHREIIQLEANNK